MLADKCEIGTAQSGSKQFHIETLIVQALPEGNYVNHDVVSTQRDTLYNHNMC